MSYTRLLPFTVMRSFIFFSCGMILHECLCEQASLSVLPSLLGNLPNYLPLVALPASLTIMLRQRRLRENTKATGEKPFVDEREVRRLPAYKKSAFQHRSPYKEGCVESKGLLQRAQLQRMPIQCADDTCTGGAQNATSSTITAFRRHHGGELPRSVLYSVGPRHL